MAKAKKPESAASVAVEDLNAGDVTINIPMGQSGFCVELPALQEFRNDVYMAMHVEVQLDYQQARTLRQLFDTLDDGGLRLRNGRRVASNADAVRWLLESIGQRSAELPSEEAE